MTMLTVTDGKLAVIVHRNHEAMIGDSEEQPLVQQNNDTIVEENHQNSVLQSCTLF